MLNKKMNLVAIQSLILILILSPWIFAQSNSIALNRIGSKGTVQVAVSTISSNTIGENEMVGKRFNKDFKNLKIVNIPEMFNEVMLAWPVGGAKISTTSPKLSWMKKSSSSETVYELEYGTAEDLSNSTVILSLTTNQIILDGLEPATRYFWRIRSIDGNNYTSYSQRESFETSPSDFSIGTEGLTKGF